MSGKATFERLYNAIIAGDRNEMEQRVGDALKEGIMPSDIIEKGMSPGMKEVGERFARYEIYLPS
ncbi:MAG: monomethylamine corrinoid protein 1, partial [Dehalococcoidia bacterium]|nr:monomethylamine corrinoid protein 1 [Dehalococcoidia bacterium]